MELFKIIVSFVIAYNKGRMNHSNDIDQLIEKLKKHSLKATPQRIAVHKAMLKLGHASADMVAREIAEAGEASITVASVYNILSSLCELGIYQRRMSASNKMFFDVNTFWHAHMYDCENDVYKDIMDDEIAKLVNDKLSRRKFRGYRVEGVDVQIIVRPTRKKCTRNA